MTTTNLGLPTWDEGNTEPNLVFNQLLAASDALVQGVVQAITATPPSTPTIGWGWIVASSPTGAWVGHAGQIAVAITGGWKFYLPQNGWAFFVVSAAADYQLVGGTWAVRSAGGSGVSSVNTLTGALTLAAGSGLSLSTSGSTLTFSGTGGGSSVTLADGFVDPTTTDGDLIVRSSATVTALAVGFIGDSITDGTQLSGGTKPGTIAATALTRGAVTVTATNQGVSGATSADWVSGSANLIAAKAAFATAGVRLVNIMLGTNDSKTAVATTATQYRTNILSLCSDLLAAGYIPVVSYPPFLIATTGVFDAGSPARVTSYLPVIDSLVDGTHVFQGDIAGYAYFQANPSAIMGDGVHPTQAGSDHLGALWATAEGKLANALTNRTTLKRLAAGTLGYRLTSGGPGVAPTWSADSGIASTVTALSIASGVVNVDCSLGTLFTLSATANVTSLTFSNLPASGFGTSIAIRIKQDATGGRTFALPASFKAIVSSDTAIQSGANAYTILIITTFDQGTRWEYSMKAGTP